MIKPIKPEDVPHRKLDALPDFVVEIWNELIAKNWVNSKSCVKQEEVISLLLCRADDSTKREDVFKNNWLYIEPIYEAQGWDVVYDRPAYNESYPASFVFTPKG
jgi:hypothetical protein